MEIENNEPYSYPFLSQTFIKPKLGSQFNYIDKELKTFNKLIDRTWNNEIGLMNEELEFRLDSTSFMDPYSLYLELVIENPNNNMIQLDGSAQTLIESIELFANDK